MSAAHATAPAVDTDKEFRTSQAEAALAGATLHKIEGDFGRSVFVFNREAVTQQLNCLGEVAALLNRVTRGDHA